MLSWYPHVKQVDSKRKKEERYRSSFCFDQTRSATDLFVVAIGGVLGIHPGILTSRELEHTAIIGVVHKVGDRVVAGD